MNIFLIAELNHNLGVSKSKSRKVNYCRALVGQSHLKILINMYLIHCTIAIQQLNLYLVYLFQIVFYLICYTLIFHNSQSIIKWSFLNNPRYSGFMLVYQIWVLQNKINFIYQKIYSLRQIVDLLEL